MRPLLVRTRLDLDAGLAAHRAVGARIALVPTMGALHEGHAALLRRAGDEAALVVASIFVNPTQFGPGEDLDRYPRQLAADVDLCARAGADVVFAPEVDAVYPEGPGRGITVDPGAYGRVLEGASRPDHFSGVLTVVAKLSGLVRPDVAVFGEKDYQQLVLVTALARDLCLRLRVVGVPTVRADDGLALSSRNAYLDPAGRRAAAALSRALTAGVQHQRSGAASVHAAAERVLARTPGVDVDYLGVTDPALAPAPESGPARLLVAARVGDTRLIDNTALLLGG
ncbi:MAG: pantoate--beta-alanine ligase [Actinomycetota bacterium]|nr:pantoate--beta-alanine ligase [Nocardioidaceae bacterium]MDQ3592692.1 pantoate--beta-alanine ligase [Actinomycetota bacterium]